jgi:DNA invertase Pin-like site-specific DNA recombinase
MRTVIDGAAQYERALIRARTKAALGVKRARGESTGAPPYGYQLGDDGRRLIEDAREQETIGTARSLRAAGSSFRSIRRALEGRGLLSRTGKAFTLQALVTMLGGDGADQPTATGDGVDG